MPHDRNPRHIDGSRGLGKGTPVAIHSARMALEPRLVFDAAAMSTGIDIIDSARDVVDPSGHAETHAAALDVTSSGGAVPTGAGDAGAPTLVVVDSRAPERDALIASAGAGRQVIVVAPDADPIAAISAALEGHGDRLAEVESLYIVGAPDGAGARLGAAPLADAVLIARAEEVMGWRDGLSDHATIHVAAGEKGGPPGSPTRSWT
jgi:hypothetical protein